MATTRTEYRIIGRFAKDEKAHVVDWHWSWTKADAERRLKELIREEERDRRNGRHVDKVGLIGIETPYMSEYALCDLRIQSREVTSWSNVEE